MHFSKRTVTWIPLKSPYQKPIQQSCKLLPTCILHFYMLPRQFHSRPSLKILPDTIEILSLSLELSKLGIDRISKRLINEGKRMRSYLSTNNILLKLYIIKKILNFSMELYFFQNLETFQNYFNRLIYF